MITVSWSIDAYWTYTITEPTTYGTETVINYETLLYYIVRYCGHIVINVYDLYVIDVVF